MKKIKAGIVLLLCVAFVCAGCAASGKKNDGKAESGEQSEADGAGSGSQGETGDGAVTPEQEDGDGDDAGSVSQSGNDAEERVQVSDFEMTLSDGETVVSFEEYRGKKVLLNFWATWCGPCVGEMPAFQRLSEEYPDELVILAVNCGEDQKTVQQFVEDNGYTFPVVLDTDYAIQDMFGGVTSIPETVIIDEEGYIVTISTGAADADTMYEAYKEELGW